MTIKVEQHLVGTAQGTGKDWVGFVPEGKTWATGMPWRYCTEGPLWLPMPTEAGRYEFVLCRNDSLTVAERSPPVEIATQALTCVISDAATIVT